MSSFRDIVFGEDITTFEALDRLSVPNLSDQIDSLQAQLDILDGNVRSLAVTVDNNNRQTQGQISDINTSISNINSALNNVINVSNSASQTATQANNTASLALTTSQNALSSADLALNTSISLQQQLNTLQLEINILRVDTPRIIRPGNVIRLYRQRNEDESEMTTYIMPSASTQFIESQTRYLAAIPSFPTTFVQAITLAGAGDNSRNNLILQGIRYPIREGPVRVTFTNNTISNPHFLVWVSNSFSEFQQQNKQLNKNE